MTDLCFAVHRDVKPSNILLVESGGKVVAKLADFDLSRLLPRNEDDPTMTAGTGTTGWRAPEVQEKTSKLVSI